MTDEIAAAPSPDDWTAEELLAETPGALPEAPGAAVPEPSMWLPLVQGHSSNPVVCPFLRAVDRDGDLVEPVESPDPANRCAALADVVPQSLRQQELVCLSSGHVNCPRYLRGAVALTPVAAPRPRVAATITPAIAVSLATLALAFVVSVGFAMGNGGLVMPSTAFASPSPAASGSAVAAVPSAGASAGAATSTPSASAAGTTTTGTSASPEPTASPSPTAAPTPKPTAKPTAAPTPKPSSNRFAILKPCPGKSDCWIYTIRSGDNLASIANYFGVSLQEVRSLNPWTRTTGLKSGQQLLIPTPTR